MELRDLLSLLLGQGETEVERKVGVPVYGLTLRGLADSELDDPGPVNTNAKVWRVRDRAFLGEVPLLDAARLIYGDLKIVGPS